MPKLRKSNRPFPRPVRLIWLGALLLFPIVLWMLPAELFDAGEVLCPTRRFFDVECFGCGSTRAIMHLHHFDLETALYHNSLSPLFYVALVVIWFTWVFETVRTFSGWENFGFKSLFGKLRPSH